jgi:peptide/nickel transport system permease protein
MIRSLLSRLAALPGRVAAAIMSPRTLRNLKAEFRRSTLPKIGMVIIALVIVMAVFAPFLAPFPPKEQDLENSTQPPIGFTKQSVQEVAVKENGSVVFNDQGEVITENRTVYENASWSHPLGTDGNGRDLLSRVIYGSRTSMLVGLIGTSLAAIVGVTVGLTAGYFGDRVDDALMRAADIMLAFPSLVLAIALVGVFQGSDIHTFELTDPFVWAATHDTVPNVLIPRAAHVARMPETTTFPVTVTLVVALVNWVWFARVARGEALSLRSEEFVKAARAVGAKDRYIIFRHVLPNAITPIIVLGTIQVAAIILLESALSFLGFSGTSLSWGFDISAGQEFLSTAWWISTVPGIAIVATVIALNLLGDWLRDALDPDIGGEGGV